MFRMNGQIISSRHNLSTYIHVGNVMVQRNEDVQDEWSGYSFKHNLSTYMVPWPFLVIPAFPVLIHSGMSMARNGDVLNIN